MSPEDVPAELVEKAVQARYDVAREGSGTAWSDLPPGSRAYVMRRHGPYMRHALAAVLPDIQAKAQQDLITDLLAKDLWSVRYELNEYPIRAVPQSALLGRRNRLARLTSTTEGATT